MSYAQPSMQPGEELASLFSRNMTFQQPQPVQQQQTPEPEPIKYSISQHYHHSAHIVQQPEQVLELTRPSSVPPQTLPSAEQVLSLRGINPSSLSPQQLDLFKTADTPQQLRLIELWQICPPSNMTTTPSVDWVNTSVEQEEIRAQLYHKQRQAEEEAARRNSLMSMDDTPLTPVQTTEGHWVGTANPEPYMTSGYEDLALRDYQEQLERQRQWEEMKERSRPKQVYAVNDNHNNYRLATDPVYASNWAAQQQQAMMEDQYGAYQAMGGMEF